MKRRTFLALAGAALVSGPEVSLAQAAFGRKSRIVVVANRNHEADGIMAAVCNQMKHNPKLGFPKNVIWPRDPADTSNYNKPRCTIDVLKDPLGKTLSATMEIWCIDDLATVKGDPGAKYDAMSIITNNGGLPDAVVAFGTAGYPVDPSNPNDPSHDGCATIGGTIFIHDASNDVAGQHGSWAWNGNMGTLVPSTTPASFYSNVAADQNTMKAISTEMISPQKNPASTLQLLISADAVGISSVNIPYVPGAPPPYCDVDTKAIAQATAAGAKTITSVETTHGVIRSKWPYVPFIYVTAIPNRVCHFDEASGNYAQEFPSSHNAGVALKYVMPYFVSAIA